LEEKTFIAFLDDDSKKKEDWVDVVEKTISYVTFKYQGKLITLPWHRILKLKEYSDE
jgi:uncharacterized protein (UPF0248 family)